MSEHTITTPHHDLDAHLAEPAGSGPHPGVVVIHDAFGMTDVMRGHADWLASEGYIAVLPNLYSWGGKFQCLRSTFKDLGAQKGVAFDDIDATRQWLAARDSCNGRTGVIGFCMGGGFALLTAAQGRFDVSSVNYGRLPNDLDTIMAGSCPIVGSYGGRDRSLRGAAGRLESALAANDIPHDVKEYPDSGHSFLDDYRNPLVSVLGVLMGAGYNGKDAADTKKRILSFFAQHLPAEETTTPGA